MIALAADSISPVRALPPAPRTRVGVVYAVQRDLRFLSHHDEIRTLRQALIRARWPLAYSRGFNPSPRIAVLVPRAVGCAAAEQAAVVELESPADVATLRASLSAALPADLPLLRLAAPLGAATPRPTGFVYTAAIAEEDRAVVHDAVAAFLGHGSVVVPRYGRDGRDRGTIDVRMYVRELSLTADTLRMRLASPGEGGVRPTEVIAALGLSPGAYAHRLCREAIEWNTDELSAPRGPHATQED